MIFDPPLALVKPVSQIMLVSMVTIVGSLLDGDLSAVLGWLFDGGLYATSSVLVVASETALQRQSAVRTRNGILRKNDIR